MIHAYLHVTQGLNYRNSHGPDFKMHMKKINNQEGTKITISHNFRKEVDKFRIHVYKCDGPCVSRRPFFGILRRAIVRPPGPTDKWWARHQRECGGTFRKIEGPGAIPTRNSKSDSSSKTIPSQSKLSCNSVNKSESITSKKTKKMSDIIKIDGKKSVGKNFRQGRLVNSNKIRKRQNFDEDEVVKKIRDKYANAKQTVLLSEKDAKHLNNSNSIRYQNSGRKHARPFYADGSIKSNPTPFGNYVEGNVNYSYQPHSCEINVVKYLNKYRAAKRGLECLVSGSSYNSKSLQITENSSKAVLKSKGFKTLTDGEMKQDKMPFNYNYVSKTPELNLGKYIERYHAAVRGTYKTEKSFISAKQNSKPVKLIMLDKMHSDVKQGNSSYSGTSRTSVCPMCNNQIPSLRYELHLKTCCGNDPDSDIEILDGNNLKSVQSSKSKNSMTFTHKVSESMQDDCALAKKCPNCGLKVLMAEMRLHLEYCTESDDDLEIIEPANKSARHCEKVKQCSASRPLNNSFVSCPSCSELVKEGKLQEHLEECLQFFSDEF